MIARLIVNATLGSPRRAIPVAPTFFRLASRARAKIVSFSGTGMAYGTFPVGDLTQTVPKVKISREDAVNVLERMMKG